MNDLRTFAPRGRFGRSREILAHTTSTMDEAHQRAAVGAPDGHLIVADTQEAGRGSRGRPWLSPPGQDLYLSIVCRPSLAPRHLPLLTLAAGLGTAECAEALTAQAAKVKWPNDVLLGRKKCAGILAESVSTGAAPEAVIVGIGLNVNRQHFPPSLEREATSLARVRGRGDLLRAEVLTLLLDRVEQAIDGLTRGNTQALLDALSSRLAYRGEAIQVDERRGTLEGLAPTGALLLRTPRGLETLVAGRIWPQPE